MTIEGNDVVQVDMVVFSSIDRICRDFRISTWLMPYLAGQKFWSQDS